MRYKAAIIAVMLAVISVLLGSVSAHAAAPNGGVSIFNAPVCGLNKFVRVKQTASEFTVHDSAGTCIKSPQHHLAFQVAKIERTLHWQYPNIASGYELGESSCASSRDTCYKYPVKQAQDGMPVASVGAWLAPGIYNLSFDAWFSPKPSQLSYTDRDGDTEIMIWLAHPGINDTARLDWHATIDGKRWGSWPGRPDRKAGMIGVTSPISHRAPH